MPHPAAIAITGRDDRRRTAHVAALALAILAAPLAASPAAAQTDYYNTDAGRPISVEDAYPIERRALEIQVAPLRLSRAPGGVYSWGIEPEFAVGILPRTQVEVGFPLAFTDLGGGRSSTGLAGVELSALHNLNVETAIPALAIAGDLLLPVGGLGPDRAYASVKGIATKTLTWARFHLNGQYTFGDRLTAATVDERSHGVSRWMGGLAVDRTLPLRSLLLTAELVARQPMVDDADIAWESAAGARFQLSPRLAVDGGAGYRLTGDEGWFVTFGAALSVGMPWSER
ncbi:MAG: hypothetical protein ACYC2G_05200 [Gemmatimonadaceae bacterium]